ncbi:MAG: bifunctional nuclease family protein [Dehalococcoidales bacterium]|nr:bifunctional nuclease family protein [Dehalococcoidales bacterium]
MIEMIVDSIRVSLMNYQRVVLLKEKDNSRYLPIWIGAAEADAIAVKLQGVPIQRPLTHDLIQSILDAFGARVKSIVVNDLKSDTFFAKIIIVFDGNQMEIDSRTSDAIALAVRVQAPIFAEENVLERAGIWLDKEPAKLLPEEAEKTDIKSKKVEGKKVTDEEMKRMSAFYEFIKDLNLDDFDKRKS